MSIFSIEKSITKFTEFFEKNCAIVLGELQIKNKSRDWAKDKRIISVNDIPKDVVNDLKQKHETDFNLYYKSFH